tara:strand:- start:1331 stop:2269 length:939 start_codon:yes stop_codon:yes gene_type:complete
MSYDIRNFAFLGYPVKDFLEKISETDVPIIEDLNYLVLDEKFEQAMAGLPQDMQSVGGFSIESIVKKGPSEIGGFPKENGPVSIVVATILSAAGVSDELLGNNEIRSELINALFSDVFVLPTDIIDYKYKGEGLPGNGAVQIGDNAVIRALLKGLASSERITLLEGVTQDDDYNDVQNLCIHNFRASMERLLGREPSSRHDTLPEDLMATFLNQFIKPLEVFVEELGEWTWDVGVVSTRYGDVHSPGGMESGELYLVISDQGSCDLGGFAYDEDGWDDPRESSPEMVEKMKEMLFGEDSDIEFQVYRPQFGG